MGLFNLDPSSLIVYAVVLIISFTVHEFAHAWTADQLGDDTPRANGRLTLNPLAHLDPIGSLMLLIAGFGWAKPVPINIYALERRSSLGVLLVSAAGPFSNFIMAILAAIPFRVGLVSVTKAYVSMMQGPHLLPSLDQFFYQFIATNLLLMLFNLIPIYPLDGEKIAVSLLPPSIGRFIEDLRPYGMMILLAVFFIGPLVRINVAGWVIGGPLSFLMRVLVSG